MGGIVVCEYGPTDGAHMILIEWWWVGGIITTSLVAGFALGAYTSSHDKGAGNGE